MNSYSGIRVVARAGQIVAVRTALEAIEGIEIHATDPGSAQLIVVQEGSTLEAHQNGLRRIRGLEPVLTADLVYHFVDRDEAEAVSVPHP